MQKMYLNENYIKLYNYCHKKYEGVFEDNLDFTLVTDCLEEVIKKGPPKVMNASQPCEYTILRSGHDFVKFIDKKKSMRYFLAQIDIAHYLLISTYTGGPAPLVGGVTP